MSSSQTRNRHTERRAGNVVQANLVAEHHGARIAAMFAADAQLQVRTGLRPSFAAICTSLPTPSVSRRAKGSLSKILLS